MDPIVILHQDDYVLVVDKPARMLVVAAPNRSGPTVLDRLRGEVGSDVFAVHRLDEDTTGVLLFARTPEAKDGLDRQLREREVERIYLTATARVPSPPSGRIESRLFEGSDGVMRSDRRRGKRAVTLYNTLERRDYGALIECHLETGRRNQIRAHLAELDCPILGDRKYGYRARDGAPNVSRPLLHAARIRFRHPILGTMLAVESPPQEPELQPPDGW